MGGVRAGCGECGDIVDDDEESGSKDANDSKGASAEAMLATRRGMVGWGGTAGKWAGRRVQGGLKHLGLGLRGGGLRSDWRFVFGVWCVMFDVWCLGCGVWGVGCGAWSLGVGVEGELSGAHLSWWACGRIVTSRMKHTFTNACRTHSI